MKKISAVDSSVLDISRKTLQTQNVWVALYCAALTGVAALDSAATEKSRRDTARRAAALADAAFAEYEDRASVTKRDKHREFIHG